MVSRIEKFSHLAVFIFYGVVFGLVLVFSFSKHSDFSVFFTVFLLLLMPMFGIFYFLVVYFFDEIKKNFLSIILKNIEDKKQKKFFGLSSFISLNLNIAFLFLSLRDVNSTFALVIFYIPLIMIVSMILTLICLMFFLVKKR